MPLYAAHTFRYFTLLISALHLVIQLFVTTVKGTSSAPFNKKEIKLKTVNCIKLQH